MKHNFKFNEMMFWLTVVGLFLAAPRIGVAQDMLTIELLVEDERDAPLDNVPIVAKRGTNKTGTITKRSEAGEYNLEVLEGNFISITFDMSGKERLIIDNVLARPKQDKQQRIHVVLRDLQSIGMSRPDVEKFFVDTFRGYAFSRAEGLSPLELRHRNLARFANVAKTDVLREDARLRGRLDQLSTLYELSNSTPQPVISEDNKFVAVAGDDRTLGLYDISTGTRNYFWTGAAFAPQHIVNAKGELWYGIDHNMSVAEFVRGEAKPTIRPRDGNVRCFAAFSPNEPSFICADTAGKLEKLDYRNGEIIWRTERRGKALQIAVSPFRTFATIDVGNKVTLHDAATGEVRWRATLDSKLRARGLAFSPVGDHLAVASGYFSDGQLFIFDAQSGELRSQSKTEDAGLAIASIVFSPTGAMLATGDVVAEAVDLWSLDDVSKPFKRIPLEGFNGGLTFDRSGKILLATKSDGGVESIDTTAF